MRWDTIAGSVDDRTPAERGELGDDARCACAKQQQRQFLMLSAHMFSVLFARCMDSALAAADPRLAGGGVKRLAKSRYDAISCYIYSCQSPSPPTPSSSASASSAPLNTDVGERSFTAGAAGDATLHAYNDVPVEVDEGLLALLLTRGVDPILAKHVAHLFTRDPLVIFQGAVDEVDDAASTEHFENIQVRGRRSVFLPSCCRCDGRGSSLRTA